MFIVLDKIVGEERVQCLINTEGIEEIEPVISNHKRYGYTAISFIKDRDCVYTDLKVGHIKLMMEGFVDMSVGGDVDE